MRFATSRVLVLVAASVIGAAPRAQTPVSIDQVGWLAGCWQDRRGDRLTEEQWMTPRGGTMVGMSRTVVDGNTVAYEYLRIESDSGTLRLIATPSGQAEAVFSLLESDESSVAFSNPDHDFPQVIRYILQPDGSLLGRIEGVVEGHRRVVDFPLERIPCAGKDT